MSVKKYVVIENEIMNKIKPEKCAMLEFIAELFIRRVKRISCAEEVETL